MIASKVSRDTEKNFVYFGENFCDFEGDRSQKRLVERITSEANIFKPDISNHFKPVI